MALSVIRTKRSMVKPAEQTPLTTLELSAMDRIPVLRVNIGTLHVFRHGPGAAPVIKEALSRALVPYYPLAGRLTESKPGYLQIQCSGDGIWFVEASAGCNLDSVNYLDDVYSVPYDDLLPDQIPRTQQIEPLVQMQVTQFGCGGFVIGLIFSHVICDGLGAAQFLNAVGELAKGLHKPSIQPVWHRDFFPTQSQEAATMAPFPELPPGPPPPPEYQLQHANIDIPMDQIHQLKRQFHESTGQNCSTFEIVAAGFWSSRTRAINFKANTQVKLVFFANCRQLLDPPLPKGFYGNCFFPVIITTSSESLTRASIFDVVKRIQEAKAKLPDEFSKYLKGEHLKDGGDPFAQRLTYTALLISDWGRLGLNQVDYQWGPPVQVVPLQGPSNIPVGIVGSMPLPKKGVRLVTRCVEEAHRHPLLDEMTSWASA